MPALLVPPGRHPSQPCPSRALPPGGPVATIDQSNARRVPEPCPGVAPPPSVLHRPEPKPKHGLVRKRPPSASATRARLPAQTRSHGRSCCAIFQKDHPKPAAEASSRRIWATTRWPTGRQTRALQCAATSRAAAASRATRPTTTRGKPARRRSANRAPSSWQPRQPSTGCPGLPVQSPDSSVWTPSDKPHTGGPASWLYRCLRSIPAGPHGPLLRMRTPACPACPKGTAPSPWAHRLIGRWRFAGAPRPQ